MKTAMAYGRRRLELRLPPGAVELRAGAAEPLARPAEAIAAALRHPLGAAPLRELAEGKRHACIVVSDITRPLPCRLLLPPLLAELEGAVGRITLLVATGTHRASTADEKLEMFGPEVVARYAIVDHDSRDPSQLAPLPRRTSSGTQAWVNRLYLEADLRVLTGLVEPHFMAGYSGGRKGVCPGLVDLRTIQKFHGPGFLEDPRAAAGVLEGNPCHREASEIAHLAGAEFTVNVALGSHLHLAHGRHVPNEDVTPRLVGVFAGSLDAAFEAAVAKVDRYCRASVPEPGDIVVTSGGGYPLDKTFYQAVKGMVGALPVVREGGVILIAAECSEGIGNREYAELMFRYEGRHEQFLRDILARDGVQQDQWEFEEQCKVLAHVGSHLHLAHGGHVPNEDVTPGLVVCAGGIEPGTLARLSVTPAAALCDDAEPERQLQGALDALLRRRPSARVVAIPDGPYLLVRGSTERGTESARISLSCSQRERRM